jgi:murein L,D-transpeptidase YafK
MKKIQWLIVAGAMFWIAGCGPSAPTGVRGGTYSGGCAQPMSSTIADNIVVDKSDRKMYLYRGGSLIKTFPVSLGANDYQGPKVKRGDKRTPIGTYRIVNKRCHAVKYMAMTISYPNAADVARAKAAGVDPGSLITIHGQPHWNADGHGDAYTLSKDWTDGCVALTNSDMRTLWSMVRVGTSITLRQ